MQAKSRVDSPFGSNKIAEQEERLQQQTPSNGRDWSVVPVSRPASTSDWHPNPLFGRRSSIRESSSSPLKQQQTKSCDEPQASSQIQPPVAAPRTRLRRHSSLAGNLHQQQQDAPNGNESEKYQASSKSNRFMSFLARIRSRQDNTSAPTTTTELVNSEKMEQTKDNLDTTSMNENDGFGSNTRHARRHRWSLRMKSPFSNNHTDVGSTGAHHGTSSSDNAYLSQVSANLDKLKCQLGERLSDTGKRASVLADQLIATIKDTTKEQLLIATTGTTARDRYDTLPNSFATPTNNNTAINGVGGASKNDPLLVRKHIKQDGDGFNTNDRKAKMFSLIYMHQQQQADGRPVITRQPTSSARGPNSVVSSIGNAGQARLHATTTAGPHYRRPQSISICQQDETSIDLDKLLDPKELLMDKFRAMKFRASQLDRSSHRSSLVAERLTQTIATGPADNLGSLRQKQIANQSSTTTTTTNSDDATSPKRRSSCTV
jgi:hypothetical protein